MPDVLEQVTTRYGNAWLPLVVWRVKSRLLLRSHFGSHILALLMRLVLVVQGSYSLCEFYLSFPSILRYSCSECY